jgi:EAL domain-containing protein (putative c-di-GMP-specific phosphodiesterase class I)
MPISQGMPTKNQTHVGLGDLSDLRARLRPGFLVTFSVAGLLCVGLLAFAVSRIMSSDIRAEQLTSATRSAELLVASSFEPRLAGHVRRAGVRELAALDQAALAGRRTAGLQGVAVWDPRARIAYSTDHRLIGATVLLPPEVRAALAGQTVPTVGDGAQSPIGHFAGPQIRVAVPIYGPRRLKPIAAAEVMLPYAPVAQQISDRTRRINLILIGAALLFYAALWPRLLRASKAIRSQTDPRAQALLRELEHGIAHDELLLHYQPTIDLAEGRVVAVEALLRWRHPKRGLLAPSEFLPTVADDELNGRLTLHIVEMALRDCAAWRDRGVDAAVNVNLSASNTLDGALPEQIGKLLATCGIPAGALGLEVTEAAILTDPERATAMLVALDRMGVRIAIDDFGTGYSSLAGLRDLPVSELKVDREFVAGLCERPRDEAIVRSTVTLAHELEVKVIAEGVEDEETLGALAALGCDMAQGYYFSRPLPLAELVAWFEAPVLAGRVALAQPAVAAG